MKKSSILVLTSLSLVFNSCTPDVDIPQADSGNADYTRFIAIGDGYMAGYQDGALWRGAQEKSIPALIFSSLEEVQSTSFNQALMPDNVGLGLNTKFWEATYFTASHLNYKIDCENVSSLSPIKTFHTAGTAAPYLNAFVEPALDDYCIPFAKTADLLSTNLHTTNPYYNRVASGLSFASPLQAALNRNPTFFAAWLGMEDIFNYCRNGGYNVPLPSPSQFSNDLDSILEPLTNQGAKGILATIPNFRSFPFYTLIPYNGANLDAEDADSLTNLYISFGMPHISFQEGDNGFVIEDPAAPSGYRQMVNGEYITLIVPTDSMKCFYYGILVNTIHDRYSLDSAEVSQIDLVINQYNTIIQQKANQYNLALVDMHSYFQTINAGILWNGVTFNAEFVSGGFFSLDGYTATQKGAALMANQFIIAMNNYFGSSLHTITCPDCNGVLFP